MPITKSNKQELSLDQRKANEMGGCTLATLYSLMRCLITQLLNLSTSLGLLHSLAITMCLGTFQMSKSNSMNEGEAYLYPPTQNMHEGVSPASYTLTGRTCRGDRTRPVSAQRLRDVRPDTCTKC